MRLKQWSTVEWIGPNTAETLVYSSTGASSSEFTTVYISGPDNNAQVLNDQEARISIVLNASAIEGTSGLGEGESAKLKITTQYGATTTYYVNVPESLDNKNAVQV